MFKLMRKFKPIDWLFVVIILGLTILKVYFTMTLMDYVTGITQAITYLNYHNDPGSISASLAAMTNNGQDWSSVMSMINAGVQSGTLTQDYADMISSVANATTGDIWYNGGMMVLMAVLMVVTDLVISVFASYVASGSAARIRKEMNDKIAQFSLAEINKFSTASLITRTTNDVQNYQMTVLLILRMLFSAPVTVIWAVCKIQSVSWELMIPILVGVVLLVIGLLVLLLFVFPKFELTQKLIDKVNGVTRENLKGIRVVHAYNAEQYQTDKFEKVNKDLTDTQLFTGRMMALLSPFITIIMNGISVAVYWIGAMVINDASSTLTYAQVVSFMMLATQVIMAFMMLLMMFIMLPRAEVAAKRVNEVLDTKITILDPETDAAPLEEGTVEFRNVAFRYPDSDTDVISGISFQAKKGQTIAFIGATGSGKSTLINLVPRFYDVTGGEVLVDGVNVKEYHQSSLRHKIGFIPQKGMLFSGTVKSNVSYGKEVMTDEEIIAACKVAEADSFINEMEKKYDSEIAQGGTNVSGGQRQRLCIARAVALHPEIMVFDDSFSALDFKTDRKVRDNLSKALNGTTKLIVAQRIGTIMDADKIVVLEEGKMVGYGSHKELLQNCPTYKAIALSQLSAQELGLADESVAKEAM